MAEIDAGHVKRSIWLSNNATETKWAQGLLRTCETACFPARRIKFLDSNGDEKLSPLQGQMILGIGEIDAVAFKLQFGDIGVVWP